MPESVQSRLLACPVPGAQCPEKTCAPPHWALGTGHWALGTPEIRFLKPGRATLYATFKIGEEELSAIRTATANGPIDRVCEVELTDAAGIAHARVTKTIYLRRISV